MTKTVFGLLLVCALASFASACSPNVCVGSSCDCPAGASCGFGSLGENARMNCAANATCTGSGGANSEATCLGTSCTFTVGAGSRLVCSAGTCNFTCNGACTSVCGAGCTITCGGGTSRSAGGCD